MMPVSKHPRSIRALTMPLVVLLTILTGCAPSDERATTPTTPAEPAGSAEVTTFLDGAETELLERSNEAGLAEWAYQTNINDETQATTAAANEKRIAAAVRLANEASRFDGTEVDEEQARKLKLLKLALVLPAPPGDDTKTAELASLEASLGGRYGAGEYCPEGGECLDLQQLSTIIETSRDPDALLEAWTGWRTISPPMREEYTRLVALANEGAQALGFSDLGAMWRSKYDMDPDAFAAELDRLWDQVRPFYEALHCHVRARLAEQYGTDVVDPAGPIPAHLLGNMWSQTWSNVYELVGPEGDGGAGYDLTALLEQAGVDEVEMVRMGERFFTSLGFEPLPETFWERSMFVQPEDRDVVCHASAWDVDNDEDLRIKMCIETNAEDFSTIHHELGHNFYQRAYNQHSMLHRDSANDGFHEAVGDTVALSVTPKYLVDIGLLDAEPPAAADLGFLLNMALDKIAFLPFGLLIDQWRWQVFSGEIAPDQYNAGWWQLRQQYQGIAAPVERTEADFDPGAKYHVPGNTPYTRYFLAHILQFQFHRALCEAAGFDGPLHRCSIYGSAEAGKRLQDMLAMGLSQPWPDALEALTGQREMDATAILDYFAPLKSWLDEQNAGRTCGW